MTDTKRTYIVISEFGELLDLADHLQNVENQDVKFLVTNPDYKKIGEGIVNCIEKWEWLKCLGEGYVWVVDGCADGDFQDCLREKGETVFGGSKEGDHLENERQKNQAWFKKAGFKSVESYNFKDIGAALSFVQSRTDKQWVLKQNGDAPKSINHVGKFDTGEDMVFHLQELQKKWSEAQFGQFDCDIMEKVVGLEVAASVFFDGEDYCKNSKGKVVGFLNFEEKKECDQGLGETTGEMGTLFFGCTEDNDLFKSIVMNDTLLEVLRASGFRGVFDVNCIKTDGGIVALEPTMRPGVPSTSYEFMEGLDGETSDLLYNVASQNGEPIEVKEGWGMVMVVAGKPYPVEGDLPDSSTSVGEKLWILDKGEPTEELSDDQKLHVHLENFYKDETYRVATKNGYLLTVTGSGDSIEETRKNLIDYIKENLYVSGMKFRSDIGKRVEEFEKEIQE